MMAKKGYIRWDNDDVRFVLDQHALCFIVVAHCIAEKHQILWLDPTRAQRTIYRTRNERAIH